MSLNRVVSTIIRVFVFLLLLLTIAGGIVAYILFSTKASAYVAKSAISTYIESENIDIKNTEGTFFGGLLFQEIEIRNLKYLPLGTLIKIQKVGVSLASLNPADMVIDIQNGRLKIPWSDTIYFYGRYADKAFTVNAYSKTINARDALDLFADSVYFKNISGSIVDVDVDIKGSYLEPVFEGSFHVEELSRDGFLMVKCPVHFMLQLKDIKDAIKLYGTVSLENGMILGPNTASVKVENGKILFSGAPKDTVFDLKGVSQIEGVKINISLKGKSDNPDLKLSSEPPLAQERLLIMLATGKRWRGAEDVINKGQISADMAKDFVDYFFFGGTGGKLAERFGISEVSLRYDVEKRGAGLKKTLSEKLEAGYSIDQENGKGEQRAKTTQKVGAGYKITDTISLESEKELKTQDKNKSNDIQNAEKPDDRVMMKFKKAF